MERTKEKHDLGDLLKVLAKNGQGGLKNCNLVRGPLVYASRLEQRGTQDHVVLVLLLQKQSRLLGQLLLHLTGTESTYLVGIVSGSGRRPPVEVQLGDDKQSPLQLLCDQRCVLRIPVNAHGLCAGRSARPRRLYGTSGAATGR